MVIGLMQDEDLLVEPQLSGIMDGPITIENQIKLQKNWEAICDDLNVSDISPALMSSGIITPKEHDDLLKEKKRRKQTEKLLSLLLSKDNQHFESFKECLVKDYSWLAKVLKDYAVTVEDEETYKGSILGACSLPQPPKCFIGRDKDVQKIINAYFIEGRRLAVIKAPGGQGKTALATAIGHTCVSKWGIRSVMADMKGVSLDEDIPLSLLLAVDCSPGLSSRKTNAARLIRKACQETSSYGKNMLIILDNCESALKENTQNHFYSLLNQLLSSCTNAYILCTTRQTIQIPNAEILVHHLGTLTQDNSFFVLQSYSQNLSREDGNHLAAKCGFVALLLHILGYLLHQGHRAIDIIAELTSKTVFGLKLSPLMPEALNASACINLSYKRLGQEMQDAVQILSFFPASFNKEDAFNLLSKHQTSLTMFDCSTCLQTLCNASFIEYDEASGMYNMHGVTQAFAQEQTSRENENHFKEMFMALMEHRIDVIHNDAEAEKGRDASNKFEKDKDSLLACIGFFESMQPGSRKATYNIAKKLAFSLRQTGRFSDSLRCFKLALETLKEQGQQNDSTDLACLYYNIGYLQGELGDSDAAVESLAYAISEYEKQGEGCNYKEYCKCCYYTTLSLKKTEENEARCLDLLYNCIDKAVAHQDLSMQYLAQAGIAGIKARQGEEEVVLSILHDIMKAAPDMDGEKNGVGMDALNDAALVLNCIGKNVEALSLYRRAVAVAKHSYGEHPETAIVLSNIGSFMVETGDLDGAIDNLRKAMAIRENTFGEQHKHTAASMHQLAHALSAQGKHAEALSIFQRALYIEKQVLGECRNTAITLYNIGHEMIELGNADSGLNVLRKALVMIENTVGPCHKETATMLYGVAHKIAVQGNHAEALDTYQRALHILEEVVGENPLTATTLNRIGHEMIKLGKVDEAVDVFRRALVMSEKIHGENDKETAYTLYGLANAISAQGNHSEAQITYQRAVRMLEPIPSKDAGTASTPVVRDIWQKMLELGKVGEAVDAFRRALTPKEKLMGEDHKDTADTMLDLAHCISAQGNHAEVLVSHQKAARIIEQLQDESESIATAPLNTDHEMELGNKDGAVSEPKNLALKAENQEKYDSEAAHTIHELATISSAMGNYKDALRLYKKALKMKEQVLGECQSTACTLHAIGHVMIELDNANDAEGYLRRALAMKERVLGKFHTETATTIHELARALSTQGNNAEALGYFQRALQIREQMLGESEYTASAHHCIGHEMILLNNLDVATSFLRRALAMREKILGKDHKDTACTLHELAYCLSAHGNHAEALVEYQKALGIMEQAEGESKQMVTTLTNLGHEMIEVGNADGAVDVLIRAQLMAKKIFGNHHDNTVAITGELLRAVSLQGGDGET